MAATTGARTSWPSAATPTPPTASPSLYRRRKEPCQRTDPLDQARRRRDHLHPDPRPRHRLGHVSLLHVRQQLGVVAGSSVHHFDQLRNLAGADCAWISGTAWNPPGSGIDTDCCGLFVLEMVNGVRCQYETSYIAAGAQNDWYHEYYRVDGERGSLVLDYGRVVRLVEHIGYGRVRVTDLEPVATAYDGHPALIAQFWDWLDGGPAPATEITDNIRTDAICLTRVPGAMKLWNDPGSRAKWFTLLTAR